MTRTLAFGLAALLAVLAVACGGSKKTSTPTPTVQPTDTSTPTPEATSTPSATSTPVPTATVVPSPTPLAGVCAPNPAPAATGLQPTDFGYQVIASPHANDAVHSPVTISGQATPFEGVYSIALFDSAFHELANQNFNKDNQQLNFIAQVNFQVPAPTAGCLWFFQKSLKDGVTPSNVTQVPVVLLP